MSKDYYPFFNIEINPFDETGESVNIEFDYQGKRFLLEDFRILSKKNTEIFFVASPRLVIDEYESIGLSDLPKKDRFLAETAFDMFCETFKDKVDLLKKIINGA